MKRRKERGEYNAKATLRRWSSEAETSLRDRPSTVVALRLRSGTAETALRPSTPLRHQSFGGCPSTVVALRR
jgi:hypothetical protein